MKHTAKAVTKIVNRITSLFLVIALVFALIPVLNISLVVSAADVGVYLAGINKSDTDLGDCEQLVVVVADGSDAQVYMYEKSGDSWSMVDTTNGVVGSEGVKDDAHEGYSATPRGLWGLGFSFGTENLSNEHLKIEYRQLKGTEEWVDDPNSSHYNQWVDKATGSKDWNSSEKLKSAGTAYKYAVVVEYNTNPVVAGKGSAIFLHVKTASSTAGCIAIPEDKMLSTLKWLDSSKSPKILNCTKEDEANGENNSANAGNSLNNGQPSQSIESSNDAADVDDRTWVDFKDLFRHGGQYLGGNNGDETGSNSNTGIDPNYTLGKATGQYAISLTDGNWYWYHQTPIPDGCVYCGTWTSMVCKDINEILGVNGCAVYSAAILASNLTGKEITPKVLLNDLGSKISSDDRAFETSKTYFSKGVTMKAQAVEQFMIDTYGFQSTGAIGDLAEDELKSKIDEVLDKNGMIWYQIESASVGNWFPPYETDQHILTIRRHSGDNYYVLDEAINDFSMLSKPVSWQDIYSHIHSKGHFVVGFWNPNMGNSDVNSSGTNGNWYNSEFTGNTGNQKVRAGQDVMLYQGLPWKKNSDTFAVDTNLMLTDVYRYVKNNDPDGLEARSAMGIWTPDKVFDRQSGNVTRIRFDSSSNVNISTIKSTSGFKKSSTNGYISTKEGVNCLACKIPPAIIDITYNKSFGAYVAGSDMNWWQVVNKSPNLSLSGGNLRLCAILEDANGEIWYLPLIAVEQDANTFPGGIVPTHMRLSASTQQQINTKFTSKGQLDKFMNITSDDGADTITELAVTDLMDTMNKSRPGTSPTAWDAMWATVEVWEAPRDVQANINNNYKNIGFIVWPS